MGGLIGAASAISQEVLTPRGERIPMDSLRVRNGMLCLPVDTMQCFQSLPLAPSPWNFRLEWREGILMDHEQNRQDPVVQSSLQMELSYDRWQWIPSVSVQFLHDDSLDPESSHWYGNVKMGVEQYTTTWLSNMQIGISRNGDGDTILSGQANISRSIFYSLGNILVPWGSVVGEYSSWEANRGIRGAVGTTWLRHEGSQDFDITPSLQVQYLPFSLVESQEAALVYCDGLDRDDVDSFVCYADSLGETVQSENPFKGILGYAHPYRGPSSTWDSPGSWWMPGMSLEGGVHLTPKWRIFLRSEWSLKMWFDEYQWNNATVGADMPDASGKLALFKDIESHQTYMLRLDGSSSFVPWEQKRQKRRDMLLFASFGGQYRIAESQFVALDGYVMRSTTNLEKEVGIQSYLVVGANLSWKGSW